MEKNPDTPPTDLKYSDTILLTAQHKYGRFIVK